MNHVFALQLNLLSFIRGYLQMMQYAGLHESMLKPQWGINFSSLNPNFEGKRASIFIVKGKF